MGSAEDIFMIQFALLAIQLARTYYTDYKCTDNTERFTQITMFLLSTIKPHSILEKKFVYTYSIPVFPALTFSIDCLSIFGIQLNLPLHGVVQQEQTEDLFLGLCTVPQVTSTAISS